MKEMDSFKKTIDRLKKEEQRIESEITKAATGFDIQDFKNLILQLVTKELVSSTSVKFQVEFQLSKPPKKSKPTAAAATTKNGKTPTKTTAGAAAKPGPALNRKQTTPAATKSTSKPTLAKKQSMPATKKEVAPKKTPTKANSMVKNPS